MIGEMRISPNTGRPVYLKRGLQRGLDWVIVADLFTDKEEELSLNPVEWLNAKRLNEMELLAWAGKNDR